MKFAARATLALLALAAIGCTPKPDPIALENQEASQGSSINYSLAEALELKTLGSAKELDDFVQSNEIAVVKFGAEWCGPCKQLDPYLQRIAGYFQGNASFALVDVDDSPELARRMRVGPIPDTFVFYEGRVFADVVGNNPNQIASVVDSMLQKTAAPDASKPQSLEEELWGDVDSQTSEANDNSEAPSDALSDEKE